MAVVINKYDQDTREYTPVGIVYQGEYYGDERLVNRFSRMDLTHEDIEEQLVDEFDGRFIQAVKHADDDIDADELPTQPETEPT